MIHIPDRFKHAGILCLTAGFPKVLRVRTRLSLLSRFQAAKARRADVLVIVHPKCGGTWLRVMVWRLYQQKYGLPSRRVVKSDELWNNNPALPRFLITNGHYSFEGVVAKTFSPENSLEPLRRKKILMLARHPCDIVVSWFIQFTKRTKPFKRELINHWMRHPIGGQPISRWEFVRHPELGLPALIDYLNAWEQRLKVIPDSLIVRYEDLRSAPLATLRRITGFLGEPFDDQALEEAVAFASFDNLRALEVSNYFRNAGLRLRNPKDPETLKVRRGKVGGYQDDFTGEQLSWMNDLVAKRLSPRFGYQQTARNTKEHLLP